MKFKSDIEVQAGLKDSSGAAGISGQVLSSNGTTVSWINSGGGFANDVQNTVKAGVAINKGQAVYVTGADGTNIIVGLASNATEATSSKTLGLLNATVAINGFADVIQIGKLAGLDTSTAVVGDPVWLGSNGNLIYGLANKPYAPLHLVYIGVVTRVNANNGEIFINVQNGFELKEIHDVDIVSTPPSNNEILAFEGGSVNLWKNKSISSIGGITGTGTTNYLPKFTGTSAIGNSLIYDNGTNIGIGTTSPNKKLTIYDSSSARLNFNTSTTGNTSVDGTEIGIQATTNNSFIWNYENSDFYIGTNNTERMRITSGGNVGIGTTSPDIFSRGYDRVLGLSGSGITKIELNGSSYSGIDFGQAGTRYGEINVSSTNFDLGTVNASPLYFQTNGSYKMAITSGGNVLINTTTDAGYKLDVNGTGRFTGDFAAGGNITSNKADSDSVYLGSQIFLSGTYTGIRSGTDHSFNVDTYNGGSVRNAFKIVQSGAATFSSSVTATVFTAPNINVSANNGMYDAGTNSVGIQTNGSARMVITSGGNVGIGTSTDAGYKLDVNGSGRFSGVLNVFSTGSTQLFLKSTGGGSNRDWQFQTNETAAGDISLLQSTTAGGSTYSRIFNLSPTGAATFSSSVTAGGIIQAGSYFYNSFSTAGVYNAYFQNTSATSYGLYSQGGSAGKNALTIKSYGGTDYLTIDGGTGAATFSSTVTASGGFFNSDMRLKDLIDYDYNVSDIKPITYLWKDGRDNKKHVGYSAQEVQKVMPDAVNEDEKGFLSVNYVEVLVAQVELLNNRITEMQKEIELLKSK